MPRPKPVASLVQVLLRLHPDTVEAIDKKRGELSRQQWIAGLVNVTLAKGLPRMSTAEVGRVMRSIEPPVAASVPLVGTFERKPYQKGQRR